MLRKIWEKITDDFPGKTAPVSWRFGIRERAANALHLWFRRSIEAAIDRAGNTITLANGETALIANYVITTGIPFAARVTLAVCPMAKVADATGKPRFQRTFKIDWRDVRREWTTGKLFERKKAHVTETAGR